MKFFSLQPPPPTFRHLLYRTPPQTPQSIQERKVPITGHPLWHAFALYVSDGPLVLEGISLFISLPSPWIHTSDHSSHFPPVPPSFTCSFSLPGSLTLLLENSHQCPTTQVVGPQDLRRCCLSEVGYEPDRSVFILLFLLSFILLFTCFFA